MQLFVAEHLGIVKVLAVVTSGIYHLWPSATPRTRIQVVRSGKLSSFS